MADNCTLPINSGTPSLSYQVLALCCWSTGHLPDVTPSLKALVSLTSFEWNSIFDILSSNEVVVTLTLVAFWFLALAKGVTQDSGGRERPYSRSRLRHQPVLPQCPIIMAIQNRLTHQTLTTRAPANTGSYWKHFDWCYITLCLFLVIILVFLCSVP